MNYPIKDYILISNIGNKRELNGEEIHRCYTISVILSTKNSLSPTCLKPDHVNALISKGIQREIIVTHYSQTDVRCSNSNSDSNAKIGDDKKSNLDKISEDEEILQIAHVRTNGKLTSSIMKALKLSTGQFILVMDADIQYPDEIVSQMVRDVLDSPKSIIIASKYVSGTTEGKVPPIRNAISKTARIVARHGLQVKEVKDPLSGCFALSSTLLKSINIEGKGDEILLEILVKLKKRKNVNNINIKEIPFQRIKHGSKNLDYARIKSYSMAVWHLYRYGQASDRLQNDQNYRKQSRHTSILFLSKAGRFFTVGASGLAVNYAVSYLMTNLLPTIWYIHATLFGIVISITSNFILNKVWTFEDRDFSIRHFFRQYALFLSLCAFGAVIQITLVYTLVEYSHIQYGASLFIAVAIASISNFLLNKKITFGEKIWG